MVSEWTKQGGRKVYLQQHFPESVTGIDLYSYTRQEMWLFWEE